ncbi:hypothetical protein, partial [Comamonas sp.]|uniref:hypothetical protein n=1 Tax=Comamonas sp. TaxID=34028 RepID=UPI001AC2089D
AGKACNPKWLPGSAIETRSDAQSSGSSLDRMPTESWDAITFRNLRVDVLVVLESVIAGTVRLSPHVTFDTGKAAGHAPMSAACRDAVIRQS